MFNDNKKGRPDILVRSSWEKELASRCPGGYSFLTFQHPLSGKPLDRRAAMAERLVQLALFFALFPMILAILYSGGADLSFVAVSLGLYFALARAWPSTGSFRLIRAALRSDESPSSRVSRSSSV
jgi:hypothetical protein